MQARSRILKMKSGIRFRPLAIGIAILALTMLLLSCSSIALYDQYAYTQATSLKVDALTLMDMATDDFSNHGDAVNQFQIKLEKAYEYEKGRPKNEISTEMWELLKNPDGNLLGGFIKRWRDEKNLSKGFIDEAKKLVARGFDLIAGLESEKLKPEEANSLFKTLVR